MRARHATADTLVIQNVDRGRGRPVATLETSLDGTTSLWPGPLP